MPEFVYQDPFPLGPDTTKYRLLSRDLVSVVQFEGAEVLKVAPEALTLLARAALRDVSFLLRTAHLEKMAAILKDPGSSPNDRGVALVMLRNAEVSDNFVLPFCQDTGTATVVGKKGQRVWTGAKDEECLSRGIYETYRDESLRYSQTVPLTLYEEKNSGTNLPAQIDLYATDGMKYEFLFVAKGGGSANKSMLFQETKAVLNPGTLEKFLTEKMKTLGTAACPPYHLVFVIGGTSAEACLKAVKLASAGCRDALPGAGNMH
ncbi:MAG: fumarate hydratase, partial [Gemmatimonadales bacterium]